MSRNGKGDDGVSANAPADSDYRRRCLSEIKKFPSDGPISGLCLPCFASYHTLGWQILAVLAYDGLCNEVP